MTSDNEAAPASCTECGKPAVTRDGRHLCLKCLKQAIAAVNPVPPPSNRSRDHKAAPEYEPSPWGENAIRHLEGD